MHALILALASLAAAPNPNPWQKVKQDDGVTIWAREVPGSSVREVKGEMLMDVPAPKIWSALNDVEHYTDFMPYVEKTLRLGAHEQGHYEYQLLDPPLVSRRDYAVKVTYLVDEQTGVYQRSWEPANHKAPPKADGVVRLEVNEGSWTLEPVPGNKTRVEYYLFTDPGGALPAWIANKANTTSVPDLLAAVYARAKDPSWKR